MAGDGLACTAWTLFLRGGVQPTRQVAGSFAGVVGPLVVGHAPVVGGGEAVVPDASGGGWSGDVQAAHGAPSSLARSSSSTSA